MTGREFDVVVWGATGFTGTLVAEYLLEQYGVTNGIKWAIAGRSMARLEALRESLGAPGLAAIVADSFDREALADLAKRTRVVLTTVGPYALYGDLLVEACVTSGTHYCDLAGEVQWIRRMIDRHDDAARHSGARIVHCCGFDSVPSDLGVWFLQHAARQRRGSHCVAVTTLVQASKGGFSGGTIASLMNVLDEARTDRNVARLMARPYALNPDPDFGGPDEPDTLRPRYHEKAQTWVAPFIMAAINTRVVRRSHALLGFPYGQEFRYDEAIMTGSGPGGWAKALAIAGTMAAVMTAGSLKATRRPLERFVLPSPGEGPDADERERGFFKFRQVGVFADGTTIESRVTGDRDPGYGSTSKMIAECAVCLAENEVPAGGGVWTPATALNGALLRRLTERAGLTFDIVDR